MKPKKETKKQREIREKTAAVYFQDSICVDCGRFGVSHVHWGPLVPFDKDGKYRMQGQFCPICWKDRMEDGEKRKRPKPLGYKKTENRKSKAE